PAARRTAVVADSDAGRTADETVSSGAASASIVRACSSYKRAATDDNATLLPATSSSTRATHGADVSSDGTGGHTRLRRICSTTGLSAAGMSTWTDSCSTRSFSASTSSRNTDGPFDSSAPYQWAAVQYRRCRARVTAT